MTRTLEEANAIGLSILDSIDPAAASAMRAANAAINEAIAAGDSQRASKLIVAEMDRLFLVNAWIPPEPKKPLGQRIIKWFRP